MDAAHVSLIDFSMPKESFLEYEAGEEETIVCLLLDKLLRFIQRGKKTDKMEWIFDEKIGKLKVRIIGDHTKEFLTPLIDVADRSPLKIPKVDYSSDIKMTTSALKTALADIKLVSEKVKVEALKDRVQFKGETYEGIETVTTFSFTDVDVLEPNIRSEASATYNVDMMANIVNELERVSGVSTLSFGPDLPLKLCFEFPEGQHFDFYLAPRIEE
jgi:proliferating cell nuclear antigen